MSNVQDNAAHTCSYSCDRPQCIKAQRDELAAAAAQEAVDAMLAMGFIWDSGAWRAQSDGGMQDERNRWFIRAGEYLKRAQDAEAKLASTPAAPGIDLQSIRKVAMPILCPMLCARDAESVVRKLHAALIDASPKGDDVPHRDLVPGVMRCAKCAFQLHRTNLYLGSGTTGPGDSKTEPCPNGCGPLWPVTWQTWATEGWQQAERYFEELRQLQDSPKGGSEARDAARWRYVRRKLCLTGNGDGTCGMQAINLPGSIPGWPDTSDDVVGFCEAAIDAAMQAQAGDAEVQP